MKKSGSIPAGFVAAISAPPEFFVGQVVLYYPPITGGAVIGVVLEIHADNPRFGTALTIRITDGTRVYPTGSRQCVYAEDVV